MVIEFNMECRKVAQEQIPTTTVEYEQQML